MTPLSQSQSAYAERGWSAAIVESGPLNAIVDDATGNLVVALGYEGVLVRTNDLRDGVCGSDVFCRASIFTSICDRVDQPDEDGLNCAK